MDRVFLSEEQKTALAREFNEGRTKRELVARYNVSYPTVNRIIRANDARSEKPRGTSTTAAPAPEARPETPRPVDTVIERNVARLRAARAKLVLQVAEIDQQLQDWALISEVAPKIQTGEKQ